MSFDWSSFCEIARELASRAPATDHAEAAWRSGTSRAYFSAYNAARQYLTDFEPTWKPAREDSHVQVFKFIDSLTAHGRLHRKIATDLQRLRVRRNAADYDVVAHPQTNAEDSVTVAELVRSLIEELRGKRRGQPP